MLLSADTVVLQVVWHLESHGCLESYVVMLLNYMQFFGEHISI